MRIIYNEFIFYGNWVADKYADVAYEWSSVIRMNNVIVVIHWLFVWVKHSLGAYDEGVSIRANYAWIECFDD